MNDQKIRAALQSTAIELKQAFGGIIHLEHQENSAVVTVRGAKEEQYNGIKKILFDGTKPSTNPYIVNPLTIKFLS